MIKPTERFSNRVENYVKYRPTYPRAVVELLAGECGLVPASVVVDVGSGTGLWSELFLEYGCTVYGVEPNREMREAGERLLARYPAFTSIDGAAEATTLDENSADFITAGQAYHWFDRERARTEFARVLRPGGWVVLVWNERRLAAPLVARYEQMLITFGTDYEQVTHQYEPDDFLIPFFGGNEVRLRIFENHQVLDFESLKGRLLSTSYAPEPGHPNYEPMLEELARIFDAHQQDGRVVFDYETKVYYGQFH